MENSMAIYEIEKRLIKIEYQLTRIADKLEQGLVVGVKR